MSSDSISRLCMAGRRHNHSNTHEPSHMGSSATNNASRSNEPTEPMPATEMETSADSIVTMLVLPPSSSSVAATAVTTSDAAEHHDRNTAVATTTTTTTATNLVMSAPSSPSLHAAERVAITTDLGEHGNLAASTSPLFAKKASSPLLYTDANYTTVAAPSASIACGDNVLDVLTRHARGDADGASDNTELAEDEELSGGGPCGRPTRSVSLGLQLRATLRRHMLLQRRGLCAYICELIIPIIFVIGSIILWVIFGTKSYGDHEYFSPTNALQTVELYTITPNMMCYNETTGAALAALGSLQPCSNLTLFINASNPLLCSDGSTEVPEGFCGLLLAGLATYNGWKLLVQGNTSVVPDFDTLVPFKWMNRLANNNLNGIFDIGGQTAEAAMLAGGKLIFTPDTPDTAQLVSYLNKSLTYFPFVYGGTMSMTDAEARVEARTIDLPTIWGIVNTKNMTHDVFDVEIRFNSTSLPASTRAVMSSYVGGIANDTGELYLLSGFMTLQKLVYDYYLTNIQGVAVPYKQLTMVPTPTKAFDRQLFLFYGAQLTPLILVLGFLYPVSQMTKHIVIEKELRIREAMLIMGVSEGIMYAAWVIIYVVQYIVISLVITILLKVTYVKHSNFGIIFFLLFFFSLTIITMSGAIAACFSKARLATLLAPLIYFVLSIPLFALQDSTPNVRKGILVLSPSALSVAFGVLFDHELEGGMKGSDMRYFRDDPDMLTIIAVLFCDFLLYGVLTAYLDAVIPKDWGVSKNPFFFITEPIRYCCGHRKMLEGGRDGRDPNGVFEDVESKDAAVRIEGLRKVYRRNGHHFAAVDNLYWSLREKEISVLLGHNGAGKTTVMNMMTGMTAPDEGDCYVYGYSVRTQLQKVRQLIGFCPQHNILWPELTCREHLEYFAAVKGYHGRQCQAAVERMLAEVDLAEKANCQSKTLSGGQKRKLSVAIAFIGGSPLVFLDEPTAGMDVGARRHTWDMLKHLSDHHAILLTTHFMDEADLLGHRIGIMSQGRLKCSGSNLFIKSKLGLGYMLTLSLIAHALRPPIRQLVLQHVATAQELGGSGAGEIAFRLPMDARSQFPDLLSAVEMKKAELGVDAYAISATTLEEIFLSIAEQESKNTEQKGDTAGTSRKKKHGALKKLSCHAHSTLRRGLCCLGRRRHKSQSATAVAQQDEADAGQDDPEGTANNNNNNNNMESVAADVWDVKTLTSQRSMFWSQFKVMMQKRWWNALRDRRTQFFQIICPLICVLLAMLLMRIQFFKRETFDVTSDLYGVAVDVDVAGCGPTRLDPSLPLSSKAYTHDLGEGNDTAAVSRYLLDTFYAHEHNYERYGAMTCVDPQLRGAASIFYNTSALHEPAIGLYNLYNSYYRAAVGATRSLHTTINPMPMTRAQSQVSTAVYAMMIAIVIMIPFTFIPSTYVGWMVKERECKARHLQKVSGLFYSVYWLTNYLFDLASYIVTMCLIIIVFAIFKRKEYVGRDTAGPTVVLFFLYGLSGVAMAYPCSFFFKDHATAKNTVMLGNFITGFLLVMCISMLSIIESTEKAAHILRWIFRIVPSYCIGEGISNLSMFSLQRAYGTSETPWAMDVVGWPCVYMAIELPVFVGLTLFIDHPGRRQRTQRLFHNPDAPPEVIEDEDSDVEAEREAVLSSEERQHDLVRVAYLRKVFANGKVAVRNLTFGVKSGEVFGFLGTNGAGKTTTISILCQEFLPTSGHASVCGYDIVKDSRQALQCIGYCPQFDATLDLLTVEEHLYMYAGIRGIAYEARHRAVHRLLQLFELTKYHATKAHELSGGNLRKLSVAISLIGGPPVVFLDEPSAGMDPVARRGLWTAIETVAENCSIVLTTHHLEEVEALAHRVAIMVDGTLRCIGNKTHLKHKYGSGFEVSLRLAASATGIEEVEEFFATHFAGSKLREYRARRLIYELPTDTILSNTFRLLEENAAQLRVTDYTVSQTSIEQVFLQISEEAERQRAQEE